MHPALSPFSQPKTSHQSSKLHPDPDCAVLCRCPMWRPFPSLFRNNWSCHRHSDAAARSHTLDSTCSSGILTPQPPALSWTVVVGSPSQDLCNPSHLELSESYADAIQALQTKRLSVDLSCWWSFQEMLGCLKCHKLAMMKTMKMMKIHQSMVLWEKHVHRAFSAVSFARVMLICWKGVAFCVMKYRRFYQMMNKWAFAQQKWEIVFSFHFFALFPAFSVACCVIGFVFSKMDPRNLWGWNFDQYNRTKRMMATKREVDHKIVFSLVVSSCYANRERDLK